MTVVNVICYNIVVVMLRDGPFCNYIGGLAFVSAALAVSLAASAVDYSLSLSIKVWIKHSFFFLESS